MRLSPYDRFREALREQRRLKNKLRAIERRIIRLRNQILRQIQPGGFHRLTVQEHRIADCLILGLTNKEIAVKFGCSVRAVKFHVSAILHKMDLQSRVQLVGLVK